MSKTSDTLYDSKMRNMEMEPIPAHLSYHSIAHLALQKTDLKAPIF